jgi:hypothetical protein
MALVDCLVLLPLLHGLLFLQVYALELMIRGFVIRIWQILQKLLVMLFQSLLLSWFPWQMLLLTWIPWRERTAG